MYAFAREEYEIIQKSHKQAETFYKQEIEVNDQYTANSPLMSFASLLSIAAVLLV